VLEVQAMENELEGRGLSAQTIRYAHAVLSAAMGQAVRWRLIQHNPCRDVEMPKRQQKEMRALTSEECGRLREAARGTRLEALWLLLLGTGMRPGEALGLRWDDLDLAKGQLRVRHSLVRTRGHAAGTAAGRLDAADARTGGPGTDPGRASADSVGGAVANAAAARRTWRLEEPKTAKSKRTIPLPPTVTRGLEAHKATQAEERLGLGSAYEAHGFVFATPFGQPLEQRNLVQRHFKPLLKNAELDSGIRLYDLRHTAATLMLASGAQVRGVADRMGHSSAKMTLDVYAHTQDGDDAQITSALEELCRG
jgi:integrase